MDRLKFQVATDNAKLLILTAKLKALGRILEGLKVYAFSLPAGHSCPGAKVCKTKADRITGKITDGPHQKYRCFAASDEAKSPNARRARWHNMDLLTPLDEAEMTELILVSLPKDLGVCRIHVSGDFFNEKYFRAWCNVARLHPDKLFYAYTQSLRYWVDKADDIPDNLNLTASGGGWTDHLIGQHNLKNSTVVFHPEEAESLGLEIDHDDSHALFGKESFALLIHHTQPKESEAAAAIKRLKSEGIKFSYSKGGKR
jgi:hypothetical protein